MNEQNQDKMTKTTFGFLALTLFATAAFCFPKTPKQQLSSPVTGGNVRHLSGTFELQPPAIPHSNEALRAFLAIDDLIWFRNAIFRTTGKSFDWIPEAIAPEFSFHGFSREFGYYIVQFDANAPSDCKDKILDEAKDTPFGAQFFYYVPNNAWVFRLSKTAAERVHKLEFVKFIAPLPPTLRFRAELLDSAPKPDDDGRVELVVQVFQNDDYAALVQLLTQSGLSKFELMDSSRGAHHEYVRFKVAPNEVFRATALVANFEGTEWVERQYPNIPFNDWSRWITQSYNFTGKYSGSRLYAQMAVDASYVPIYRRNIYGQNQLVGYCDSGLDTLSIFFCDPGVTVPKATGWTPPTDTNHRKIRAYNRGSTSTGDFDDTDVSLGGHGTHVGGSIAGENATNAPTSGTYDSGDGMAPLARLVFTDGANGTAGIYTPSDMNTLFGFAQNCGAYLHSNSYGSSSPNSYTTDAQECDEFMWNNKSFLIFFAAGNDNTDGYRVATYNCAKSMVSVGAVETGFGYNSTTYSNPGSTGGNNPENMAEFSSHGPTDEGLLKPSICTPGGWYIWSADNIDGGTSCHTGTRYMGGTSMACPTAAGITALIRQYFTAGFYPTGAAVSANALTPSGALMKAMLILGTRNMSGSYTIDAVNNSGHKDAPSNGQGWGRVVLDDCMYFSDSYGTDARKLFVLSNNTTFTAASQADTFILFTGTSTTEATKVVLSFSDYPGSPAVGTSGVNDLDLTVTVGSNTYKGNVFATTGARSTTGGTADGINRDEVVWLDATPSQMITIIVRSNAIRTSPQPYALVAAGDLFQNSPPDVPGLTNRLFDNERTPDTTPEIRFTVPVDYEGSNLNFRLQWDDAADFATPLGDVSTPSAAGFAGGTFPVPEGTGDTMSYTFQSALTNGQTYWWRICAYDGSIYGMWTTPRSFTINTSLSNSDWYQTKTDQFNTDALTNALAQNDSVALNTVATFSTELAYDDSGGGGSYFTNPYYFACNFAAERACTLKSVRFYASASSGATTAACSLFVWAHSGSETAPGSVVVGPVVFRPTAGTAGWYSVTLPSPYYDSDGKFWVGAYFPNRQSSDTTKYIYLLSEANSPINQRAYYASTRAGTWTNDAGYDDYIRTTVAYPAVLPDSGSIVSTNILFRDNIGSTISWEKIKWTENAGDSVRVAVQYRSAGSWVNHPDTGTTLSGTAGEMNVVSLSARDTIRVKAIMYRKAGASPAVKDLNVTWAFGTPTPALEYASHIINDATGDADGYAERGESVIMPISLRNIGTATATTVSATITSSDPLVTVTDNAAAYTNITAGSTVQSNSNHFAFTVANSDATCGHSAMFIVSWTCNSGATTGVDTFYVPLGCPAPTITYVSCSFDDVSGGDGDGIPEASETIVMPVTLAQTVIASVPGAQSFSAVLSSADAYVTITDNAATFPNFTPGSSTTSNANHFAYQISPSAPDGHVANFALDWVSYCGSGTVNFSVTLHRQPNILPDAPGLTNRLFNNERTPDDTPEILFTVPDDGNGDFLHFRLQWDDAPDFATPLGDVISSTNPGFAGSVFPAAEGTGDTLSYTFQSALTNGQTYWWRICANDGTADGAWTSARSFTVNTALVLSDWHQTTTAQWSTDSLTGALASADNVTLPNYSYVLVDSMNSYANHAAFAAVWTVSGSYTQWQTAQSHSPSGAVRVNDASTSAQSYFYRSFTPISSGYVSVWTKTASTSDNGEILRIFDGTTRKAQVYYRQNYIAYWDGTNRYNMVAIEANVWHHVRVNFNCAANQIYVVIDGTTTFGPYTFEGGASSTLSRVGSGTYVNNYTCDSYYDDYEVGQPPTVNDGTVFSTPIVKSWATDAVGWTAATWNENAGDSIVLKVQKRNSGTWVNGDSISATGTSGTLPLTSVASSDTIRLGARLVRNTNNPVLANWTVTFDYDNLAFEILRALPTGEEYIDWNIGMLSTSAYAITDATSRAYIKNTGGAAIDLKLSASVPTTWTYGETTGADRIVLSALFNSVSVPILTDFSTSDTLGTNLRTAGLFGSSAPVDKFVGLSDGVNIPSLSGEYLYLLFRAPTSNTYSPAQSITITIQAAEHLE